MILNNKGKWIGKLLWRTKRVLLRLSEAI
jgi:hypothetical protein